jgi:hypothetical protein
MRTPSPPATINVEMASADRKPRASNSTPEELRTGPGTSASTLIGEAEPAPAGDLEHRDRTRGIKQLEIGKYENANHDSAPCPEIRVPARLSEKEGNPPF